MSVNVNEMQENIDKLLVINRDVLSKMTVQELQEMEYKLQIMSRINSLLHYVKFVPFSNIAVIPEQENPFSAAVERERMEVFARNNPAVEADIKAQSESEEIASPPAQPNTIAGATELMFSQALKRSIRQDVNMPLSPQSSASTTISMEPAETDDEDCPDAVEAQTPETPKTEYRTISLSTSSPRG